MRLAAFQARAQRVQERAEVERSRHESLDVVYKAVDRDVEVGGGIIAGALAYRFFIWLLPFALVLVVGLGLASSATSKSPTDAAKTLGLAGLVSSSVASASDSSTRLYALIVGVPALLLATRSVLRALIGAHRLVWGDVRADAPKPTVRATLRFFALVIAFFLVTALAGAARAAWTGPGIVVSLLVALPYAGFWLLVSQQLPHLRTPWRTLVPGALLFAVGIEFVQLITAYFITPIALTKQGTYGALGAAAALLLGLFMISRLMVGAAVLNATLAVRADR